MSTNLLGSFDYEGKPVRMVGTAERPEWVAADVCAVLEIQNNRDALAEFSPDEAGVALIYTSGQAREMRTVTEPGLYRLISRSRKPEAEAFQRWVFHEVLPSIRKHGCYPPPEALTVAGEGRAIVQRDHELHDKLVKLDIKVETGFARLENKIDAQGTAQVEIHKGVRRLVENLDKSRRNFIEAHTSIYRQVCRDKYDGLCPVCQTILIVDDTFTETSDLNYDHFNDKQYDNKFENGWPICVGCNQAKKHASRVDSENLKTAFNEFHRLVRLAGHDPVKPKIAKTLPLFEGVKEISAIKSKPRLAL